MLDRRRFVASAALSLGGFGLGAPAWSAAVPDRFPDGAASKGMINGAAQKAIDLGLSYLARNRNEDGSFGTFQYRGNVAITSLAGLAMMSGGHLPGRGIYGDTVLKALRYVMEQEDKVLPGYLHNRNAVQHGPMYSHGFGTLFLAEAHGTVVQPKLAKELRELLKRAVQLILVSQNTEGGWRYRPGDKDADISVTICQIMALRAARNAGIDVPKEKVDRCIDYVKRCQDHGGGFRYMAQVGPPAFARTAAGVAALLSAGIYKGPEIERGLKYLAQFNPKNGNFKNPHMHDLHYFYGNYYAAMAMWTVGGDNWNDWYPAIRDELINRHNRNRNDGHWSDSICGHYGTAMACIILQIPNNYLPILQK